MFLQLTSFRVHQGGGKKKHQTKHFFIRTIPCARSKVSYLPPELEKLICRPSPLRRGSAFRWPRPSFSQQCSINLNGQADDGGRRASLAVNHPGGSFWECCGENVEPFRPPTQRTSCFTLTCRRMLKALSDLLACLVLRELRITQLSRRSLPVAKRFIEGCMSDFLFHSWVGREQNLVPLLYHARPRILAALHAKHLSVSSFQAK